eukprot:TRINITY_DN314_c0_g1_i6.p1 TRINITY_DN314_c0_g1~~TRINITY_DN314_c0_g1_i6.p1  ORF type:complete len:106 (-),score=16.54 TRINITY_DN314_c0_g1_i6:699-1016(-)
MELMNGLDEMDKQKVIEWIVSCQLPSGKPLSKLLRSPQTNLFVGGFGGNIGHDAHLLYTMSAVQVLCMYDAMDRINKENLVTFISSLQKEDGSFAGDEWGEIDTR